MEIEAEASYKVGYEEIKKAAHNVWRKSAANLDHPAVSK